MKIVITGAGLVGSSLAEQLLLKGHDIAIVEKNTDLCLELEEKQDLLVVQGSGSDPATMKAAGIDSADIVLAVTPSDEVNIIACSIAMFHKVEQRVARIRNPSFFRAKNLYDINSMGVTRLIDPEITVVNSICQFISTPGAHEAAAFESGKILLREYKVTAAMPVMGKNLKEIREISAADNILVMT
ncbi:NAD-binding protein, partial [bacterium]|nr:NAD-binding protein [bacterium]